MSGIEALIHQPVIQALGWALLHFLWQGALVGAVAAIALRLLRRSAADVRYVVASVALSLMATLPVVTGVQAFRAARVDHSITAVRPGEIRPDVTRMAAARVDEARVDGVTTQATNQTVSLASLERWLPLVVIAWMAGVAILAIRLVGGWLWLQRMKSHGAVPADAALQAVVRRLSRSLHLARTITLLRSPGVDVPTVIGWLRPTVLLPMSALSGLSPVQVEAILAHELAHVRRHDYLVNLLQTLLETLLFYHPAVWWISRQIRRERENCCDDLAVGLCGDRVVYARALADLEAHRGPGARVALAASGGALLERVRRLLTGPETHAGRGPAWLAASSAVLLMLFVVGGALGRETLTARSSQADTGVLLKADTISPAPAPAPVTSTSAAPRVPAQAASRTVSSAPLSSQQAPPEPPAPPMPPSPPSRPETSSITIMDGGHQQSSGNFTWSSNGEKLEIKYQGTFELSDDDTSVAKLSPNGYLRISDGGWMGRRSVEFTSDSAGTVQTKYYVGSRERAFEPEGRQWLAEMLPKFVRRSGFGAKARVARYLRKGGVPAVLAEISNIEGSYGKKVYFTELLKQAPVDGPAARRLLEQAGREITSDYELASTLIDAADKLLVDDAARKAYFDATRGIDSDYEMRRVLSAALKRGTIAPALMVDLLDAARALESDYESASLLLDVIRQQPIEGALRRPFFTVVGELSSDYERGRVLKALVRRSDVSAATLVDILNAAGDMGGGYETSQVLQTAARSHSISGPARDTYLKVADTLGEYEQGQALTALVRSERGK